MKKKSQDKKEIKKIDETEKIIALLTREFRKEVHSKSSATRKLVKARLHEELSRAKESSERLIHGKT
jgi:hypothetical protein